MVQIARQREWRFVDTGISDAFLNMAIDEVMLDAHLQGACPPTLRVYRWNPPALSLGYFQNLDTDIETKRCSDLGIDIVRRLTGGRAVLHRDELTYSVVASQEYGLPKSLAESYRFLNEGLRAAYGILGLEISCAANERRPSLTACFSSACFSCAGLADLTYRGRKLCGSAQFRKGSALLQHGSLPISLDARSFFSVLKFASSAMRERALADFAEKAASLSDVLGRRIGWQELKEALFRGFQTSLGIELHEEPLTPEELDLSQRLAREKYRGLDWSYDGR